MTWRDRPRRGGKEEGRCADKRWEFCGLLVWVGCSGDVSGPPRRRHVMVLRGRRLKQVLSSLGYLIGFVQYEQGRLCFQLWAALPSSASGRSAPSSCPPAFSAPSYHPSSTHLAIQPLALGNMA